MDALLGLIGGAASILVVALGFGAIIFIHELGHFLAAKWAGIRVLAFAVGFGPAVGTYRKGLGFRRSSTEAEVRGRTDVSPTEYRLNALPLGGYVKMLGQDDLDPGATSAAGDSYQSVPVWKRLIVISAGVVMNLITAALLFVFVFMVGLQAETPRVGAVTPGSPADVAVAINADQLGVERPGLQPGDRIVRIDGDRARTFNDVVIAAAMAARDQAIDVEVERAGVEGTLAFTIVPTEGRGHGLLELGVAPAAAPTVADPGSFRERFDQQMLNLGLPGLEPEATLVAIDGAAPAETSGSVARAFATSGGKPVELTFEQPGGATARFELQPRPELMHENVPFRTGTSTPIDHILGLVGVMTVADIDTNDEPSRGHAQGLRRGDVFVRLGETFYPSLPEGIRAVSGTAGRTILATVLRDGALVELDISVQRNGLVGFAPDDTLREGSIYAAPPSARIVGRNTVEPWTPPAATLMDAPGTRILEIAGTPVSGVAEVRAALRAATAGAFDANTGATLPITLELPIARVPGAEGGVVQRDWALPAEAVAELHALRWEAPFNALGLFDLETFTLRADDPLGAVGMGLHETRRVMLSTYLTLARLFEGTVRVEHLRGPVGIAHMGTRILDRGFIWLLFFFGLISVNLAVINFLPIPIVDGGQFLMLCYEGLRGKPLPVALQNGLTLAGLVLIGSIFVIVTFQDVRNLFGL